MILWREIKEEKKNIRYEASENAISKVKARKEEGKRIIKVERVGWVEKV